MRQESILILSALDDVTRTGGKFDASQLVNMSFHVFASDAQVGGTVKIQASNDPVPTGALRNQFTPTNWVDIPNASITLTAASGNVPGLIILPNVAVGWIRAVFTQTTAGNGTIKVNMNGVGV